MTLIHPTSRCPASATSFPRGHIYFAVYFERGRERGAEVAQLDRALPPSLLRPWRFDETGEEVPRPTLVEPRTQSADFLSALWSLPEAYEVACMELAAFLAWLIAQARDGH